MKIVFATMPFDGHFNPMTGLAVHLQAQGHEIRWYSGPSYAHRLEKIGIPNIPYERAREINAENLVEYFPEYSKMGMGPKAITFGLKQIFFGNLEAHFRDLTGLYREFPFEVIISDGAFYASRLIAEKLPVRSFVINPSPTPAPSYRKAPPPFFGLKPATNFFQKLTHKVIGKMVESSTKDGMKILHSLRAVEKLPPYPGSVFDLHVHPAVTIFQIGSPGFEYPLEKGPENFRYLGPLLPHRKGGSTPFPYEEKQKKFPKVIVVSQGTMDNKDPGKLFVPSLEALRGGPHLVLVTTGGRNTEELRKQFPDENIVIEDYLDFESVLERASIFICNGGYGSVMLALMKGVPILSAGKLEGKADINARLDYCGLGIDLKTERPTVKKILSGATRILSDTCYREKVARLREELLGYSPFNIIEQALAEAK